MTATHTTTPVASAPGVVALVPQAAIRHALTRAACLALLAPGGHGRVAATMRAIPVIIAVSFNLFGDDVVFSPGLSDELSRAVEDSVVAFQTDHIGSDGRPLWDVHVTGVARALRNANETSAFRLSSEIVAGWRAGS